MVYSSRPGSPGGDSDHCRAHADSMPKVPRKLWSRITKKLLHQTWPWTAVCIQLGLEADGTHARPSETAVRSTVIASHEFVSPPKLPNPHWQQTAIIISAHGLLLFLTALAPALHADHDLTRVRRWCARPESPPAPT